MRSRSSEATRRWLNDIQHHIAMAQGFIAGINYEAFKDDNLHLYAVTRCLEIIFGGIAPFAARTESQASVY